MNEIDIAVRSLRDYAMNINALTDITFLISKFSELNLLKLNADQKNFLNDSLMFMIEQVTQNNNKDNIGKITVLRDIVDLHIFNNLEQSFYHYYLSMRESIAFNKNNLELILRELLEDEISFLSELQQVSFVNFLDLVFMEFEDRYLTEEILKKIKSVEVKKEEYPTFAPSQIKILTEANKALQEELANVNYVLMMGGLL